jgi:RTX calcium-binding nonapeptide repeat (4 copies)/Beta-propeller repeat
VDAAGAWTRPPNRGSLGRRWPIRRRAAAWRASSLLAAAVAIAALAVTSAFERQASPVAGTDRARPDLGRLPLSFEANRGQVPPRFDFLARTAAGSFLLGPAGARVLLSGAGKRGASLSLSLPGSSPGAPQALSRLPGDVNYLVGQDRAAWRTGIPTFARVRYPAVWPGVALDWYGDGRRLEYDFRLQPGADPETIRMRFGGARALRVAGNGDLLISTRGGTMRQRAPVAYQAVNGERQPVDAAFSLRGGSIGFRLGPYDASRPLVIDPVVLAYSTYLGGDGFDGAAGVTVDGSGAAYVVGSTSSSDFNLVNSIEGDSNDSDIFVSKLTPSGNALAYSTYLGGNQFDQAGGIAVDPAGSAYITGTTNSTDFNIKNPLPLGGVLAGGLNQDVFVSKLTPQGNDLVYSTYLGGANNDVAHAIAVDPSGAAYVTGVATGDLADFPLVNQIQTNQPSNDAFVSKLVPAGTSLAYSTYLGGNGDEEASGIAVDPSGAAYVTGVTSSTTSAPNPFPLVNAFEGDPGDGQSDAFVSKLVPAGTSLAYSTFLGGDAFDLGSAIAVDGGGAAYVTGSTASTDFPSSGPIQANQPDTDAFVTKLLPTGNALGYSTYLGGDAIDMGQGIAVTPSGAAHVTGTTESTNFPTVSPLPGGTDHSGDDPFVSQLTSSGGGLGFSTLLGGSGDDTAAGIAADPSGADYVVGLTSSTDFRTLGPIEGDSASSDAFISNLAGPPQPPAGAGGGGACAGRTATLTGTDGPDVLTGTAGPDVIAGLGGDDQIRGLAGADAVCGGAGRDRLIGGKGKDRLLGEAGRDRLAGGKGKDKLVGAGGKDKLIGGKANDKLKGGPGKDNLSGGGGRDKLKGGGGKDTCTGGPSKDAAGGCERRRSI